MGGVEEAAQVACPRCGAGFRPVWLGQLYCSPLCAKRTCDARRKRRNRAGARGAQPVRESRCRSCGGELPPLRLRYCSKACRKRFKERRQHPPVDMSIPVPCQRCGAPFTRTRGKRFCSLECRPSWVPPHPLPVKPRPVKPPRICVSCGEPFVKPKQGGFWYACSYRCELDRRNAKVAKARQRPEWRANDGAMRAKRQQEQDAIIAAVRELGWLDGLLEAVK